MVRKQKKPKAGHQKPKWRKPKALGGGGGGGGGDAPSAASGTMSSLRSAFKRTVRGGGAAKKPSMVSRVIDAALWVAVGVAVVYFIANAQCTN